MRVIQVFVMRASDATEVNETSVLARGGAVLERGLTQCPNAHCTQC